MKSEDIWEKIHILSLTDSLHPIWMQYFYHAFVRHGHIPFSLTRIPLPAENQFQWSIDCRRDALEYEVREKLGATNLPIRKSATVEQPKEIPPVIHQMWIGERDNPCEKFIDQVREMNDFAEHRLHGNELLDRYSDDPLIQLQLEKGVPWSFISTRLRVLLLKDEGGIYIDTDIEPIKSLEEAYEDTKSSDFVCSKRTDNGEQIFPDHDVFFSAKNGQVINDLCCLEQSLFPSILMVEKLRLHKMVKWVPSNWWYAHEITPDSYLMSEGRRLKSWSSTNLLSKST